jgi:hypothetical protein
MRLVLRRRDRFPRQTARSMQIHVLLSDRENALLDELAKREGLSRGATMRLGMAFLRFTRDPQVAAALRAAEDRV